MSVVSGILNARAARDASKGQQQSEAAAQEEMRRQFDLQRQDQAPWLRAGGAALNQLSRLYGLNTGEGGGAGTPDYSGFMNSPDYQFALQQGQQATERSAAARGNLLSGNTLAAAQNYGQGLATQNYGRYVSQLSGLAGVGQASAQNLGALGGQYSQGLSNSLVRQGDARASGVLGQQAAYNNATQNGLRIFGSIYGGGFGGGGGGMAGGASALMGR